MLSSLFIIILVFVKQVSFILVFALIQSFDDYVIPLAMIIAFVTIYILLFGKISRQLGIEKVKFDIIYTITWIMLGLLNSYIILADNVISRSLIGDLGPLDSLRYLLVPIYFSLYIFIVVIYCIYSYIRKNKKK